MAPQSGTQAVDRAAALLVAVVDAPTAVTFGGLVDAVDLPKSTASRLLGALERQGLVDRDRDGAFLPGRVLTAYARRARSTDQLVATARPYLETLAHLTGETVNLAVPGGVAVEQVDQVDSRFLLGATNWVGREVPYHCSALGKVFLAHGVARLPAGRLEQRTSRTITTRAALAADLAEARRRGWAVADEELESGLVAIAAPVVDGGGRVVGALSVSGPTVRLTPDRVPEVGAVVAEQAVALSRALGHRTPGNAQSGQRRREEGAA
jgi:IclR family transcriptional regulator, acetate operon repressor